MRHRRDGLETRPSHPEPSSEGSGDGAAALDRALVYEHLCQIGKQWEARLLPDDKYLYLARRAEVLSRIGCP